MDILSPKKNTRLLRMKVASPGLVVKSVTGGYLVQTTDAHRLSRSETEVKTGRVPTESEWAALEFAWKVCKHVKSNAIVYARPRTKGTDRRSA